jgi:hypothetical protein
MPDFSTILQTPEIRALVQENLLERAFHDALFPRMLFRGEATPVPWPAGTGDVMIFSAPGLIAPNAQPLVPGTDPDPVTYTVEQWEAMVQQYAGTIDTHMPTSIVAIANLFMRNSHQLAMMAAQTMNRITRNRMYGAALSGWTVADGAVMASTTLRVKRLNGFTRARRPDLPAGSAVRFNPVSASNPLPITVFDNGVATAFNVIGFAPDNPGDEQGPGTLTLNAMVTNVLNRAYVISSDRTNIQRVGGGLKVDTLVPGTSIPTLADIRAMVAKFWTNNVPEHPDGRFHAHFDPTSQSLIFNDTEFQRLLTALPDYYMYRQFALGEMLNTVFFRNSEAPIVSTVIGGSTATYDLKDPFAGELTVTGAIGGSPVHRILFTAQGGIFEYHQDPMNLITEAGVTGRVADAQIVNNGIEVLSDRIQLVIRQPLNRLQDLVSTSWKFLGDWPVRTDSASGDAARFKRFGVIEHTE